jgi:CubicO group peptidase (beta-lactamase class C family)
VSKFIPEFENLEVYESGTVENMHTTDLERPVSIRHLLCHTSGLTYGFFDNTPVGELYRELNVFDAQSTLKDMIVKLGKIPLLHQPGSNWNYGVSHDVLGYLVEVLSNQSLDQFLAERIFVPLKMKDTGFFVPKEKLDRFASLYGPAEGGGLRKLEGSMGNLPVESSFADGSDPELPLFLYGGGGLLSTASDYMRFAQMLLNGGELEGERLLSPKSVELMMTNHVPEKLVPFPKGFPGVDGLDLVGQGFGFGLSVVLDVTKTGILGSEGLAYWGGAANTSFGIDPEEELIFMVWSQYRPLLYEALQKRFQVLTYQAVVDSFQDPSK